MKKQHLVVAKKGRDLPQKVGGGGLGLPWGRGGLDPALGLGEGVLCGLTGGDWGVPWLGDTHPVSP